MDPSNNDADIQRLEFTLLAQVRNAAIFWFVALNIFKYPRLRPMVYWVLGLAVFILILALIDYFPQRSALIDRGISIPSRLDLLWASALVAVFIIIWMLFSFWQGACDNVKA